MIDSGGGTSDVEVLAYVNSNLIVIYKNQAQLSSSSSPSSSSTAKPLVPSKLIGTAKLHLVRISLSALSLSAHQKILTMSRFVRSLFSLSAHSQRDLASYLCFRVGYLARLYSFSIKIALEIVLKTS